MALDCYDGLNRGLATDKTRQIRQEEEKGKNWWISQN